MIVPPPPPLSQTSPAWGGDNTGAYGGPRLHNVSAELCARVPRMVALWEVKDVCLWRQHAQHTLTAHTPKHDDTKAQNGIEILAGFVS